LKKPLHRAVVALAAFILGILISGVLYVLTGFSLFGDPLESHLIPSDSDDSDFVDMAYVVVEHIKNKDYRALSRYVHPELGVVFSPYATITLRPNLRFTANQVAGFARDRDSYIWGVRDGTGEPIEMTPNEYFSEFVFTRDYTTAPMLGIDHIVRRGNALENITEVFPDVRFVDFHFPGNETDSMNGHSWSTLRLGFEDHNGRLRLTAIIRSVWTV